MNGNLDAARPCRRSASQRKGLIGLATALFVIVAGTLQTHATETLRLGGTGGDLGTLGILGEAFERSNPGVTVSVLPSLGSGGGIKAVLAGKIDLSIASRPAKDKERAKGASSVPYGKTALVFAVPLGAPYRDITTAEALAIYAGEKSTWPDGQPIRLILRPEKDGDNHILSKAVSGMEEALAKAAQRRGLPIAQSDQDNAEMIEGLKGGIGATTLSLLIAENRALQALALDGVTATAETIQSGTYAITKTFHLVRGPKISDLASRFIAFMGSPEGVEILRETGHLEIPIPVSTSRLEK